MEMAAPPTPSLHFNGGKNLSSCCPNYRTQIQLPLQRPEYKVPRKLKLKLKPPPWKPPPTPHASTVSDVLRLMDSLKLRLPLDIYASLIKECTELGNPSEAIELHKHIKRSGLRLNLPLLNRLLLMYVLVGCLDLARQLFDQMPVKDINSWAIVIAGFVESGEHGEAVDLFIKMVRDQGWKKVGHDLTGFSTSGILICVLKACLNTNDLVLGKQVHGWSWKMGYSRSVALSNFLINFYGKMKCSDGAENAFGQAQLRNPVAWTSRIVNCCNDDDYEATISAFKEMSRVGVRKNGYTFSTVLKACVKMGNVACGRQVHADLIKWGLEFDCYVQCALVDLYGKFGFLKDAAVMFEVGKVTRNVACCNAMLVSCIQSGMHFEAIQVVREMEMAGIKPLESVVNEIYSLPDESFRQEAGRNMLDND